MWVYFIRECSETGLVKIGIADSVERRLSELQTGNGSRLKVVATVKYPSRAAAKEAERLFHKVLGPFRARGEWFTCARPVSEVIKAATGRSNLSRAELAALIQQSARKRARRNRILSRPLMIEPDPVAYPDRAPLRNIGV